MIQTKPLPRLDGLAGEFYGWCKKHELRFQRCMGCGLWRHVPRLLCPACSSADWQWTATTGRGQVFTWVEAARAMHPAFAEEAPYTAVVVEMEEGVRIVSRVIDCPPDELSIGMSVNVVYDDVTEDVSLPLFKRAEA
jgi:uncharacterized OB-fold protein